MSKNTLLFVGPVATRSGYGEHARDIVRGLIKLDKWDIKIFNIRWGSTPMNALQKGRSRDDVIIDRLIEHPQELGKQPEIHVQCTVPNEFQPYGKYNIGITAGIETNLCSPEWIEGMNRMNMVIVPSNHAKDVFEKTVYTKMGDQNQKVGELKCTVPIEVVFEGVDREIYKKTDQIPVTVYDEVNKIDERFCFLYVGHWLNGNLGEDRKNVGMLVKIFMETFKDKAKKPALILKSSGAGFSILDRTEIMKKIEMIKSSVNSKDLPNIYLLHGDLFPEEMNGLYNHPKVKAHITFTKGEGFGRPLLEASVSGKPVVASNWSGHTDFLDPKLSVMLSGELTQIHESSVWDKVLIKESKWFTVNYNYAAQVMANIFREYDSYTDRANRQRIQNEEQFSIEKMDELLGSVFTRYVPDFPSEVKIKLPTLKKMGE